MQDSRAFVRAPPGDGFPEPWAHAGRHHGDPRLARYCVRRNRPVINLSGPIHDESLTPDRVTTPEDMAEFRSAADNCGARGDDADSVSVAAAHCDCDCSSPLQAAVEQRNVTITVDISNDKGELVDLSEQRNVRQDDLPLPIDHDAERLGAIR